MSTSTEPRPAPASRRGASFWVGALLVLAGLGVLGYVGWEMYGTNVVSHHRAQRIEQQTQQAWAKGYDGPAGGIVRIPRFGRHFSAPIIKGFDDATLAKGVAWYPRGVGPGQVGNYVLAGHRVTHGEPFSKFPSLRKGDLVRIETRTTVYTYRLRNSGTSTIVDFRTAWPLYPVPAPGAAARRPTKAVITLITCSELFHTDNRSVVIGDLVSARPRGGVAG
ncbi:class E sortase [Nocardioides mangrovicus]|uniref:Class E sortase n=1 Tax=Nocardioides mangrovicus TaxID=2478913 RepID=A0A3L8P0Z3_9ACTN|nr:sortase [Nocardioides mangrovicus]RLV48562.1 class E sortase [Nocardioides mangrovicus]